MKLSVVIPTYEFGGKGVSMLQDSFRKLYVQNFTDFEVIISDDSENDEIGDLCRHWRESLDIKYMKNPGPKGASSNLNNAVKNSSAYLIKVLCADDLLLDETSLSKTVEAFDWDAGWLISAYHCTKDRETLYRTYYPYWNENIIFVNSLGTHSALTFVNDEPLLFDTNLVWHLDCEYYFKLANRYGLPTLLQEPTFVQYIHDGQMTNTIVNDGLVKWEYNYLLEKYRSY